MSTIVTRAGKGSPLTNAELDANFNNLNAGKAGLRRLNVNGDCAIAQNGVSFAAAGNGTWTLDGYYWEQSSEAVVTISQAADAPADNEFQFSHRATVTTADGAIAATQYAMAAVFIEGYDVRHLIGRNFTISFWVRSAKTGVHCVCLRNSGYDRFYVAEYTVNAANTWEKKSIKITGGLITAGTWNWANGTGLRLHFILACGATYQGAAGAWGSISIIATNNQVNCLDTVGNIFAITGVQVAPGDADETFDHWTADAELRLAQRYYESGYVRVDGYALAANKVGATVGYRSTKRATPTVLGVGIGYSNASGFAVDSASDASGFEATALATATGGCAFAGGWSSSARLP